MRQFRLKNRFKNRSQQSSRQSSLQRSAASPKDRGRKPWLGRVDRYIVYKFLSTYIFLITIIVVIAVIFDFNEKIDKLTQSHAPLQKIVFDYYVNFVPYFANLFSPLFVFIAVIFFTSKLADNSEIIAMKSTGMSFRRLLRPYMFSAALIALTTYLLGAYVIPQSNVARVNFENRYIKKKTDITSVDNVQMQVDTGVVAYITHFDNVTKSGYGFSLDKFVDKKLVSHLTAQSIQYDTLSDRRFSWTLRQYKIRTLKGMREKLESGQKLDTIIVMEPKDFFYVRGQQETMTVPELDEFIDRQKLRGAAGVSTFEVEYHKRFATPFAAFILTLIGVSLSCEKRKGGMGASIGVGIALSFTYILFQTVSATFAINAGWPAMFSVWLPNIIFALIAVVLYRRTPQ
ncbi:LptF/LptG family permease [bacterium]|nr:LptF/LptG family permease [bacterium]